MQAGEKIILLDNSGAEFECELEEIGKNKVSGKILEKRVNGAEAKTEITLYQALPKNMSKFEEILKNGVGVGIAKFVPLLSSRCEKSCIARFRNPARLEKIIRENTEQSERTKLPEITGVVKFEELWAEQPVDLNLVGDSFCEEPLLSSLLPKIRSEKKINLFIGPEGGFSAEEIELMKTKNAQTFSLGKRILRTETAGVAIASAIIFG